MVSMVLTNFHRHSRHSNIKKLRRVNRRQKKRIDCLWVRSFVSAIIIFIIFFALVWICFLQGKMSRESGGGANDKLAGS